MSDELRELFGQYTSRRIDLGYLLSRLPREETIGTLADLLDEYYRDRYEG